MFYKTYNNYLSSEVRDKIAHLRAKGKSIIDIARAVGHNQGIISRELRRHKSPIYAEKIGTNHCLLARNVIFDFVPVKV